MPVKYTIRTRDSIAAIAAIMREMSGNFERVAKSMDSAELSEAFIPWSPRHDEIIQIMAEVSHGAETAIQSQVAAKRQGIPSRFEQIKKRSARDVAARRIRQQDQPRRPRGRPRKTPASENEGVIVSSSSEIV